MFSPSWISLGTYCHDRSITIIIYTYIITIARFHHKYMYNHTYHVLVNSMYDHHWEINYEFMNYEYEWFVDNKLSIHFGEDKTKTILFTSKNKMRNLGKLDIHHGDIKIKQHSKVTYF